MRYVKQTLQFILPDNIRKNILNELVSKYNISKNVSDYYLTKEEILIMKDNGMEFGLHTENHKRLELLSKNDQKREIIDNLKILKENNVLPELKAIAYPFGSYNEDTLKILDELKINLGFAANKTLEINDSLEIKRIDCNVLKEDM